jgi:cell division septation protein DedD
MAPVISRMEPEGRELAEKLDRPSAPQTPVEKPTPRIPSPPIKPKVAPPPLAATPDPGPPEIAGARRYTVLLGAFNKQENALNLKTRLESAGLPAAISEVTERNKLWYRVMSGVFEDKDSAEAYGRELRQRKLVERPYVKPL